MKKYFIVFIGLIVAAIFYSALSESKEDYYTTFKGIDFKPAFCNTGPIVRRYLITVSHINYQEMELFGERLPYTKLGTTEAYFFLQTSNHPTSINLLGEPFSPEFDQSCVGHFKKGAMGKTVFKEVTENQ